MRTLEYAMQFHGNAAPVEGASGKLKASTRARSCQLSAVVGNGGLRAQWEQLPGEDAHFESEVELTGATSFLERGSIRFGKDGDVLRFSTVGEGYIGPSPDPNLKHGCVAWTVEGGEGRFAGAKGLITSNFTLGGAGEVVDRHFGLLFLP